MKSSKYIVILALMMGFISCNDSSNGEVQPITFTTVAQGSLKGNGQEGILKSKLIIDNHQGMGILRARMNSFNQELDTMTLDFEKIMVLAVFDEIKSTAGHSIDMTKVEDHGDYIQVQVERLNKGGMLTILTQPFHLISIPKTDKPVKFNEVD